MAGIVRRHGGDPHGPAAQQRGEQPGDRARRQVQGLRQVLRGGAPVDLERRDQPPVDVIEERISHELLYGSLEVPLGVKLMRMRS